MIRELNKHIEQSIEVEGFYVLENSWFRKSVVATQISQKMIPPKNTYRKLTGSV